MITPLATTNKLAGNPIKSLEFSVKVKLSNQEQFELADPRITRALVALMDMNAVLGGAASHYGGPAAFAELMSAAHGVMLLKSRQSGKQWFDQFHFVNDAGHCENGLYALKANYGWAGLNFEKLKGFRSIQSVLTGHGESHLFPEAVYLSNGPLGSSFPQSQGLAMAEKAAGTNRITLTAISDGACMEGEARESMAAIPGFAKAGKLSGYVLIVSDNNTKLSGRIDKESFSMGPTFSAFESLGWKVLNLEDGHDLQKCFDTILAAVEMAEANPNQPVMIHARTIKGIGTKKTAESSSGAHGFPLKSPTELPVFIEEILEGMATPAFMMSWIEELKKWETQIKASTLKPTAPEEKIQNGVSAALIAARKKGFPVVSITSDLPGSTGVAGFRKEFPEASYDVGIAESNMISAAAGFSKQGFIPVVDTFAQFGVTKGALPLTMASLSEAPMIAFFSHTGFQDAADGASHQGLTYLSMVMGIPHVKAISLSSSEEAEALVGEAITKFADARKNGQTPDTIVFFLGRENFPKAYRSGLSYQLGKDLVIHENVIDQKTVTIAASGSLVGQALLAADKLKTLGYGAIVIHGANASHPDFATLTSAVQKSSGRLITVEDHQVNGGYGCRVVAGLAERGGGDETKTARGL
jgi:transketolase